MATIFESTAQYLKERGIVCVILGQEHGYPVETLVVSVKLTDVERTYDVLINIVELFDSEPVLWLFQTLYEFPFTVESSRHNDVCGVLGVQNSAQYMGCFCLDDFGKVNLKHIVLNNPDDYLNGEALYESLRMFAATIDTCYEEIEDAL